ncbi:MAG: Tm-1-like ATP-binding domain-containing protein [Chloroflexota bacterium]|nr:Tm-1-like ATP-binding domain-containing protein [Chloroflexota bacterium]
MPKTIIVIGTLDTKGQEIAFVRDLIANRGHQPVVIDSGIQGEPTIEATISRGEVAAAAETTIEDILAAGDKNNAISTMARGVTSISVRLRAEGKLDAVLALGGVQGTVIGTAAMRALPVGVPKLMVSTVANGQATFGPFVGTKDVTMMHSVADILGLNMITRQVLAEAAGAVVGMAELALGPQTTDRPTVAMTMAGVTTACVMRARERFEEWGYEVIAFHCNGIGAKAMEELADAGQLRGILDLSPHDIGGYLRGGLMQASPDRLEAVSRRSLPIVFVPGGLDFILFGPLQSIAPEMLERNYVVHNPIHTHVRANRAEMSDAGRFVAERLSQTTGPATIMIPGRGFSQLNIKGGPLFDPEADQGFIEGLRAASAGQLAIAELDLHINEPAFAEAVSTELRSLMEAQALQ